MIMKIFIGENTFYQMIHKVIGHIEEKNESKYFVFDSTDENQELLKNTQNIGMGLKIRLKQ